MKKAISLLLAASLSLALVACGGGTSSTPASTPASTGASEPADAVDGTVYHVGILQLVQHDALDAATQGFKDALVEALGDAVVFDEQNAQGDSNTCATIANNFEAAGVNLIMANATAALQAAAAATDTIPILATSITDYASALEIDDWTGTVGGNISGTTDLAPLDGQAAMLAELFPEAGKVGLLYCSAEPNSKFQVDNVMLALQDLGYECTLYSFSDSNDLQSVCQMAASENDVLYVPTDNTAASNTEIVDNVCRPAGVPVIAGEEGICAGCGVATLSISYYDLGYATGKMAVEILANGADISAMPIESAPQFTKKYNAVIAADLNVEIPADYVAIED